jgi:hypothetical protein
MEKIISKLIIILLSVSSISYGFASHPNLDDAYNSVSGSFSLNAFGDDKSHSLSGSAIFNPAGDVLIGMTIANTWIDKINDVDVGNLDIEEYDLLFNAGYVIRISDSLHIIPGINFGGAEISALGYHVLDADISEIGATARFNSGNSITSFGISRVEIDDLSLVGGASSYVTAEEQAIIESASGNEIALTVGQMYEVGEGAYTSFNLSTLGFDTFSVSASILAHF